MNNKELINELLTFNDTELKFKEYYFRNQKLSKDDFPEYYSDDDWLKLSKSDSVSVLKHDRYNPAFIHSHEHFEGIFVLTGNGICSFFNEDTKTDIKLKANDFVIIPPNKKHSLSVFNNESIFLNILIRKKTFRTAFFDFIGSNNILNEFFVNYILGNSDADYILYHTEQIANISAIIINMYRESTYPDIYSEFMLNQLTKEFFVYLLRLPQGSIESPDTYGTENIFRNELIKYISENFKQLTLNDVANHFHFTVPYTSKIIKQKTGTTFSKLLRDVRMEHAKKLLSSTNMKISEISEAIGYPNIEHFFKLFKNEFKITPSQYRNKYRNRAEQLLYK